MNNLAWYGVIITQIITESLPISSSGHVSLLCMIFGISLYDLSPMIITTQSWLVQHLIARSVDHFLHGPTFIIVALFFYHRWMALLKYWRKTLPIIIKLTCYVGIADFITGLFFIAWRCIPLNAFPLGAGFAITAFALASLIWCPKKGGSLTARMAIILGIVQGCALLPGISRFATTYAAARWLTLSPRYAFEIAWMIQMPLMGISFIHSLIIFWQIGIPDQILNLHTAFVMLGASIGGWYALRFAAYVSARQKMWWFACYMIIPLVVWMRYK